MTRGCHGRALSPTAGLGEGRRRRRFRNVPVLHHDAYASGQDSLRHSHEAHLALLIALLLLATLPFWIGNSYYINIATQMLIYAILATRR